MTKRIFVPPALILLCLTAMSLNGCSHGSQQAPTASGQPSGSAVQVTAAAPAPFNPTVTPPPAPPQVVPAYVFNNQPAPIPAPTPIVEHHRHRYLHIVLRDHRCYLADDYGDYYETGRDDDGDVYPIYQYPNTGADYPLYYDEERDQYYRCVDDGDGRYYRNYIGDPDDQFYQGDPDQQEECESEDSQPFVVNYDDSYDSDEGYDPDYANYSGPRYSRHNHDFVEILPVIVAAYILLEPSENGDRGGDRGGNGNWNGGRQTVRVNNHNYYRSTVIVNNTNSGGGNYAAQPGPPIGHFAGYKGSGHGRPRATRSASATRETVRPRTAYAPTQTKPSDTKGGNPPHFRGARQNGRQVMAAGAAAQPYQHAGNAGQKPAGNNAHRRRATPVYRANRPAGGQQTRGRVLAADNKNSGGVHRQGAPPTTVTARTHAASPGRSRKATTPPRTAAHAEAVAPVKREAPQIRQYQAPDQHHTQTATHSAPEQPLTRHYTVQSRPTEQVRPQYHAPQQQIQQPRRQQYQAPRQQQQIQAPRQSVPAPPQQQRKQPPAPDGGGRGGGGGGLPGRRPQ